MRRNATTTQRLRGKGGKGMSVSAKIDWERVAEEKISSSRSGLLENVIVAVEFLLRMLSVNGDGKIYVGLRLRCEKRARIWK